MERVAWLQGVGGEEVDDKVGFEQRRVSIDVDGGSMAAYLSHPSSDERRPAIIVIHEIFGLDPHTEDVANRFAAQGYVALAPDLFWKVGGPQGLKDRAAFRNFRLSLDDPEMQASLDAALAWLREQPAVNVAHIAIIGFCMGGYYALLEASANPTFAACIDFYGSPMAGIGAPSERRPRTLLDAAAQLRVPYLGMFGAEDESIPLEQIHQLEEILGETGHPHEIHVYPGAGHAFFNDRRPAYREQAATDAWPTVLNFLARFMTT